MKSDNIDIHDLITSSGLEPPKKVTIMITNRCNLSCGHCMTESDSSGKTPSAPTTAVKRLIEEFASTGVTGICFTGGEPLLHPDWPDLLNYTCMLPGIETVELQTNATLLTTSAIDHFSSIPLPGFSIQISLDGIRPETNDKIRGEGVFNKIINGIRLLTSAGLGSKICVAFSEMQHNFSDIPDLMEFLDSIGVGSFTTGTLVLGGRARNNERIAPPTPAQYENILSLYHWDSKFRSLYEKMGNIAAIEWYLGKSNPDPNPCRCIRTPYITADGDIYPCKILTARELAVSDVYERPLKEVITKGLETWRRIPDLNRERFQNNKTCKRCGGKHHCSGGCMGRAYFLSKNFTAVEDRCELRKTVYSWLPVEKK